MSRTANLQCVTIAFGAMLLAVAGCAAPKSERDEASEISAVRIAEHVATLASDDFGGRFPGTRGETLTTAYIARAFEAAGAEPLLGAGWMQPVRLARKHMEDGGQQEVHSNNVVAVVRGRTRADEFVLYVAHWDHLGICADAGAADRICNGAVDNASGIGGLLELAKAFASGPRPERSVIFLATTAEESGMLGTSRFIESGAVPLNAIVAVFGLDTIAVRGRGREVVMLGRGLSNLDRWVEAAARAQGRHVVSSPMARTFFTRSDHYLFAVAGVPSTLVTGLFATDPDDGAYDAYMTGRYHKPSDEADADIDYSGAVLDVELILHAGQTLANSDVWPAWRPTSRFQRGNKSKP